MSQGGVPAGDSSAEEEWYPARGYWYPASDWQEIARFYDGDECDPRGLFRLTDDEWGAWPYAEHGRPSEARKFKFNFGHLRSPIKLYAKWYCYTRMLEKGGKIVAGSVRVPYDLSAIDTYLVDIGCTSLDEIAMPAAFRALWKAILIDNGDGPRLRKHVMRQLNTHPFWVRLRAQFGIPLELPSVAPYERKLPVDYGADNGRGAPHDCDESGTLPPSTGGMSARSVLGGGNEWTEQSCPKPSYRKWATSWRRNCVRRGRSC